MVEKSPTRGADSSMNLRVMTASGSVSLSTPRAGAAATAVLVTLPVTTTASTSCSSLGAAAAVSAAWAVDAPNASPAAMESATSEDAAKTPRRRKQFIENPPRLWPNAAAPPLLEKGGQGSAAARIRAPLIVFFGASRVVLTATSCLDHGADLK